MLYRFHAVLIASGILYSFGFSAYEFAAWRRSGEGGVAALAAVFAVFGTALVLYLWSFLRSRRDRRSP